MIKYFIETKRPTKMDAIIDRILEFTQEKDCHFLKNREVLLWLFGNTDFLGTIEKKSKKAKEELKEREKSWGLKLVKNFRPNIENQWTTYLSETVVKEAYELLGEKCQKPKAKGGKKPDWETTKCILEVKAKTYWTSGTTNEKILGTPYKYADIPELYEKPLKIICVAHAEKQCRDSYGVFGACSENQQRFLDLYKELKIEFVGFTNILKLLIN